MSKLHLILILALLVPCAAAQTTLKVVFIADTKERARPERAQAFEAFLSERFTKVKVKDHASFDPKDARWADVVVLDWHQGGNTLFTRPPSPIGRRAKWNRPIVLIGSAGLNLAMSWDVFGGSG